MRKVECIGDIHYLTRDEWIWLFDERNLRVYIQVLDYADLEYALTYCS